MDKLNNATDLQKHAFLLGYIIYFVMAIIVANVVLQKIAARRQSEEDATVEAFVRQQDYK
jgi:multisubunit Na+/H+ antiporter MnhE subunit